MVQSTPRLSKVMVKELENQQFNHGSVDHRDQVRAALARSSVLERAEVDFAHLQELAHDTVRTRRAIDRSVLKLLRQVRDM